MGFFEGVWRLIVGPSILEGGGLCYSAALVDHIFWTSLRPKVLPGFSIRDKCNHLSQVQIS